MDNLLNPVDNEFARFQANMRNELDNIQQVDQPFLGDWYDLPEPIEYVSDEYYYKFKSDLDITRYFTPGQLIRMEDPTTPGNWYTGYCLGVSIPDNEATLLIEGTGEFDGKIPSAWQSEELVVSIANHPVPPGHSGRITLLCSNGTDSNSNSLIVVNVDFALVLQGTEYKLVVSNGLFAILAGSPVWVEFELPIDYTIGGRPLFTWGVQRTIMKLISNTGGTPAPKLVECYLRNAGGKNYLRVETYDGSTMTGSCVLNSGFVSGRNVSVLL